MYNTLYTFSFLQWFQQQMFDINNFEKYSRCAIIPGPALPFLLPLFQEGPLSVTGGSMSKKYW